MMSLIAARAPSLILWTSLETGLAVFVYSQWQKPSIVTGPLPSAIPKGYFGRSRFGDHPHQPIHIAETTQLREAHSAR
ncbi:uncharacterized protein BXZ73DRAFT_106975 [Epithele typhae]|uniref:uncharacterized protein n=1 Tax=Epithele typhae TaxID=378194 RepID=UPI002007A1A3|nr:uncharacterized protein BXZ73DRAFT_106975 [Epithele typhae]KAH9913327.1 hypothetical protein BXZ73DRAFT_106975 [Epithele typhae]